MKSSNPPRLAVWLLEEFGPEVNREALTGDLNEAMAQGRSKAWYWRQVLAAIRWRRLLYALLISALVGWLLTSSILSDKPPFLNRPIDMAVIAATYFASGHVPGMMRRRLRILLALLIAAIFVLFCRYTPDVADHYWIFFWMVASNFAFYRKALPPPPYHLTLHELVYGDPKAERERLVAKLHLAMMQETDLELRQAYAEAIATLRRDEPSTATAMQ